MNGKIFFIRSLWPLVGFEMTRLQSHGNEEMEQLLAKWHCEGVLFSFFLFPNTICIN